MFLFRVRSTVVAVRSLLLFAILILLPAWAQAADMSFDGGSGCSDPPIFNQMFSFTVNTHGGFCSGFANHSGKNFDSLNLVLPTMSSTFLCPPDPFFTNCAPTFDTAHNTLTILFSGLDGTHHGIPVHPTCPPDHVCPIDDFFINLNNCITTPLTGGCSQPHDF